ncbi:hypothetical protein [Halobacillus kuroshimensis]|uniref:hypothetical protein n=1 Tax=Halobacillus kuroshimensis TaxID=302481 RepID=UPI0003F5E65A|nr:hypothetical protein [Halobacillus kuroshimensis]
MKGGGRLLFLLLCIYAAVIWISFEKTVRKGEKRRWIGAGVALLSLLVFPLAPLFAEARASEHGLSTVFIVFLVHLVPAVGGTALLTAGFFTSNER